MSQGRMRNDNNEKLMIHLQDDSSLKPFVDFVRDNEELALCFRENRATIYRNRHLVWDLSVRDGIPIVAINITYARYMEGWDKIVNTIMNKGFKRLNSIKLQKSGNCVSVKNLEFSPQGDPEEIRNDIKESYNLIKKMQNNYYSELKNEVKVDRIKEYYREKVNTNLKESTPSKQSETETKAQQKLFNHNHSLKGLFIYDMEYLQPGAKSNNKPDLLGIRFDSEEIPCSFCMIEVKSKESALKGTSGVCAHKYRMEDYAKDKKYIEERKKEAFKIINQYKELNLYKIHKTFDENINVDNIDTEIIFVFTDPINMNSRISCSKCSDLSLKCKYKNLKHKTIKNVLGKEYTECDYFSEKDKDIIAVVRKIDR